MKKIIAVLISVLLVVSLAGCGKTEQSDAQAADAVQEIGIAYQYGLAYAPLVIMQEQKLIEKHYESISGKSVNVVWNQMSSGADINTAIASGSIDVGYMGIAPAITGVTKHVGYKIFTNLSGQEHGLMTNDSALTSLSDLVNSDKQIALVNIGSIQHIILAKTLAANGFDAHALDANLVAMKHPDGMAALESANVACHLTSNPYIYMERDKNLYNEINEVADEWSAEQSFIVGVASERLYQNNPDLYKALCEAVGEAITYINANKEAAAALTCELDGNTPEDELKYMNLGNYSTQTKGIFELALFMAENSFIEEAPAAYGDLVFDNVVGD